MRASSSVTAATGPDGREGALDGPASAARNGSSLPATRNPMSPILALNPFCSFQFSQKLFFSSPTVKRFLGLTPIWVVGLNSISLLLSSSMSSNSAFHAEKVASASAKADWSSSV